MSLLTCECAWCVLMILHGSCESVNYALNTTHENEIRVRVENESHCYWNVNETHCYWSANETHWNGSGFCGHEDVAVVEYACIYCWYWSVVDGFY